MAAQRASENSSRLSINLIISPLPVLSLAYRSSPYRKTLRRIFSPKSPPFYPTVNHTFNSPIRAWPGNGFTPKGLRYRKAKTGDDQYPPASVLYFEKDEHQSAESIRSQKKVFFQNYADKASKCIIFNSHWTKCSPWNLIVYHAINTLFRVQ